MFQNNTIHPILLAGGIGTRLWPLSSSSKPKQFINLNEDKSLFQSTANRFRATTGVNFAPPTISSNVELFELLQKQIQSENMNTEGIILEPYGRNTAAAILCVCLQIQANVGDVLVISNPTDHLIEDDEALIDCIKLGITAANSGGVVTFGIKATSPATGYGYIRCNETSLKVKDCISFTEKPDRLSALNLMKQGQCFWNSGIYLFRISTLTNFYKTTFPDQFALVHKALISSSKEGKVTTLNPDDWEKVDDISIDFAMMEKFNNIKMIELQSNWNDIGTWAAINEISGNNNIKINNIKNSISIECDNTFLHSETGSQPIVAVGLRNAIAVSTPEITLILDADHTEQIDQVRKKFEAYTRQIKNTGSQKKSCGNIDVLYADQKTMIRRISVAPGEKIKCDSINLDLSNCRLIEGELDLRYINGEITRWDKHLQPPNSKHCEHLINLGKKTAKLIEIVLLDK